MGKRIFQSIAAFLCTAAMTATGFTAAAQSAADEHFTVENYYKIKWGHAEEFIGLWTRNHYPLLKKAQQKGDVIRIVAQKPLLHSGEDTRWDFKVTIVFKNAQLAFDHGLTDQYKAQLYPDAAKLAKEEQYRFELLLAHWDVMTETIPLDK